MGGCHRVSGCRGGDLAKGVYREFNEGYKTVLLQVGSSRKHIKHTRALIKHFYRGPSPTTYFQTYSSDPHLQLDDKSSTVVKGRVGLDSDR